MINTIKKAIQRFPTPFYLYDSHIIENRYKEITSLFEKITNNVKIYYSVKSNFNPAIIRVLYELGCNIETAYDYEHMIVNKMKLVKERILHNSLYNSDDTLNHLQKNNITINFDSVSSFERYHKLCISPKSQLIGFRVNFANLIDEEVEFLLSGDQSKLGINLDQIIDAYVNAYNKGYRRFGILCMQASNVFSHEYYIKLLEKLIDIVKDVETKTHLKFEYIDLGGGFGISLDEKPDFNFLIFAKYLEDFIKRDPDCKIYLEPGRFLVANSGFLVTKIVSVKKRKENVFYIVNAGTNNFVRKAWFNFNHSIDFCTDSERRPLTEPLNSIIMGPLFDNKDVLAEVNSLPLLKEGDYIILKDVGAYGAVRMSNYGAQPYCAEVLHREGKYEIIREAQSFDQFASNYKEY